MYKVGVISDTHGMLRPEVLEELQNCDKILHGGDVNKQEILDKLRELAPVYAVRGNNDREWAKELPGYLSLDICGLRIYMVHNKKDIPDSLPEIDLVIYGHSHKYENKTENGIQYLNPGSCGPRRFRGETTFAVLEIHKNGKYTIEKKVISHGEKKASEKEDGEIPSDIAVKIPAIMKEINAGKSVKQIAKKYKISEKLSEQITRMYLTHPGIDVEGILRRIGL